MSAGRRLPLALAGVLTLSLLGGCMTLVGTDYQRPEVALPTTWRAAPPQVLADAAAGPWWQGFGDPHLDALVAAALENNRDLRVAVARVREFEARLAVSQAADKPQVGYGFTGTRTQRSQEQPDQFAFSASPKFNAFQLGLSFGWEVDLWGQLRRANEAAQADLMAAEAAQRGVMLTVVTAVATSYVELLGLDQQLAVTRELWRNRLDNLAVVEARAAGGSATQVQVQQARAEAQAIEATLPALERSILSTEGLLGLLTGRPAGSVPRRSLDALAMPAVPADLPVDLLARRPDVMQAEQALRAANARIGVAEGERWPRISLTGALGVASDSLRWLLAETARAGEFSRGIGGVAYSGGRVQGGIDAATAVRDAAAESFQKAVQTGLYEVDQALVGRQKSREQGTVLERQLATAREGARLARLRFESGRSTKLEWLDAERRVLDAQGQVALARRDEFGSLVAVYKAMGGGWMDELNRQQAERVARAADAAAAARPRPPEPVAP